MKNTEKLTVKPTFVKTANVRNAESMMDGLALADGEGRFGLVHGRAGRGKTRWAQHFVANNRNCHYILALHIWRNSLGELLKRIAFEIGLISPPGRVGALFTAISERLVKTRPALFIDEPEKLTLGHIELLRDLTEATAAPIIMVGEEDLLKMMSKHRRVWSRTYQQVEFKPFGVADIVQYAAAAAGVRFTSPSAAEVMFKASEGDIRIVRRDLINLVQILNAKGVAEADEKTAAAAVRQALHDTADYQGV